MNEKERKLQETKDKFSDKGLDNPDMMKTNNPSIYDMHEDMKTVDSIPVEELNEQVKDEADHNHTKNKSASEEKYKPYDR